MPLREPAEYSSEVAAHIRRLGHDAVLVGALAANRYRATPRFTTDADFLLHELGDLPERLRREGYEVQTMAEPGGGPPYLALVRGHGVRFDLIVAETAFQRSARARAQGGVISVEDVIVFKLLAWRPRDRDDVDSILAAGHQLDEAYIEHWAREWEVLDRWDEAKRR